MEIPNNRNSIYFVTFLFLLNLLLTISFSNYVFAKPTQFQQNIDHPEEFKQIARRYKKKKRKGPKKNKTKKTSKKKEASIEAVGDLEYQKLTLKSDKDLDLTGFGLRGGGQYAYPVEKNFIATGGLGLHYFTLKASEEYFSVSLSAMTMYLDVEGHYFISPSTALGLGLTYDIFTINGSVTLDSELVSATGNITKFTRTGIFLSCLYKLDSTINLLFEVSSDSGGYDVEINDTKGDATFSGLTFRIGSAIRI